MSIRALFMQGQIVKNVSGEQPAWQKYENILFLIEFAIFYELTCSLRLYQFMVIDPAAIVTIIKRQTDLSDTRKSNLVHFPKV